MTDTVTLESLGASLNWEAESQGAEAATQESWWHQRGGEEMDRWEMPDRMDSRGGEVWMTRAGQWP